MSNFKINLKFEDVNFKDSKGWFEKAVKKATENGFLSGYKDGTFKPNNKITRFEMIKITYKITTKTEIEETDFSYLENTQDNRTTMITCIENNPTKRLCVQAVQI